MAPGSDRQAYRSALERVVYEQAKASMFTAYSLACPRCEAGAGEDCYTEETLPLHAARLRMGARKVAQSMRREWP